AALSARTARSSAPGTTSGTIAPSRRSSSGWRGNEKAARSRGLACLRSLSCRSRQRERRDVRGPRKRDLDHLQLRVELIELRHGRFRLRVSFARAFLNPLFAIVDPHKLSFHRSLLQSPCQVVSFPTHSFLVTCTAEIGGGFGEVSSRGLTRVRR